MTTKILNVAVLGSGRMGQQVARVLEESEDCRVAGIWRRYEPELLVDLLKSADAATKIPLLYDRNMSLGIAIMTDLIRRTSAALGSNFSAEILETHHIHKQDAPSGTAINLQNAIAKRSVMIESQREGDVIGKHRVRFVSAMETLEFEHAVSDRDVFARGAVSAARWLIEQSIGLYDMADMAAFAPSCGSGKRF